MNEEEIEAIQILNNFNPLYCGMEDEHAIETILNLVDKQQEEIGKLEGKLKEERNFNKSALETLKDCVHKDRIRKIIEEYRTEKANMTQIIFSKYGKTQQTLKQAVNNEVIKVLEEILGESK